MPYYGSIWVTDRAGWSKFYPMERALLLVGSASHNHIVLPEERGDIAPVHLQLVRHKLDQGRARAVNLSDIPVALTRANQKPDVLLAGNSTELEDGDTVRLADYTLTFTLQPVSLQSVYGVSRTEFSEHDCLSLKLEMPSTVLRPMKTLSGQITVANRGPKRCQFELDLEGLPSDCYRIDPAPLLFPNSEERLQIRFFHLGTRPYGKVHPLVLRATATEAYPNEEIVFTFSLDVSLIDHIEICPSDNPIPPWEMQPVVTPSPAPANTPPAVAPLSAVQEPAKAPPVTPVVPPVQAIFAPPGELAPRSAPENRTPAPAYVQPAPTAAPVPEKPTMERPLPVVERPPAGEQKPGLTAAAAQPEPVEAIPPWMVLPPVDQPTAAEPQEIARMVDIHPSEPSPLPDIPAPIQVPEPAAQPVPEPQVSSPATRLSNTRRNRLAGQNITVLKAAPEPEESADSNTTPNASPSSDPKGSY